MVISDRVPAYVTRLFDVLKSGGHRGYLVGGCVRDLLRGVMPHDFDITTDATPDEMLSLFAGFRVIPTGLAHGTVTVLSEGHPVEITTHRTDGAYTDSRHPDSVSFTRRLQDDLSRRDFTVNAMAWSAETGLVDLFEGQKDLERGVIRAVGDPVLRFGEDALRILRCFRFAAALDFAVESETAKAARTCRDGLLHISAERIFAELQKLLVGKAAEKGLAGLFEADCIKPVFFDTLPDFAVANRLSLLPPDAAVRLAALLHERTPEEARDLCRRLRTSNAFADQVAGMLTALRVPLPTDAYTARRFVCRYFAYHKEALLLREVLCGEDVTAARDLCLSVLRDRTAVDLHRLAVNGLDLQQKAGVRPADTAKMLALLQDAVWHDPTQNKKEALLALAREIYAKGEI